MSLCRLPSFKYLLLYIIVQCVVIRITCHCYQRTTWSCVCWQSICMIITSDERERAEPSFCKWSVFAVYSAFLVSHLKCFTVWFCHPPYVCAVLLSYVNPTLQHISQRHFVQYFAQGHFLLGSNCQPSGWNFVLKIPYLHLFTKFI